MAAAARRAGDGGGLALGPDEFGAESARVESDPPGRAERAVGDLEPVKRPAVDRDPALPPPPPPPPPPVLPLLLPPAPLPTALPASLAPARGAAAPELTPLRLSRTAAAAAMAAARGGGAAALGEKDASGLRDGSPVVQNTKAGNSGREEGR